MSRARRDLLARLRAHGGATTVDALAGACGQHPNTVREHLEALVGSGHVQRVAAPAPSGRGRPARLYRAAEQATAPAAAATLASVLAAQLASRPDARAEGIAAGRAWAASLRGVSASPAALVGSGRAVPASGSATPDTAASAAAPGPAMAGRPTLPAVRDHIAAALTETGFAAEPDVDDPAVLRLTRCPLLQAAREHPDVVCSVHLGLVRGLLDDAGDPGTRARLLPFAASDACLLRLDPAAAP